MTLLPAPGTTSDDVSARPRDSRVVDAGWVLGVYVLLGVVAGVLWWLLVDPAVFTVAEGGGVGMGEVELGKRFNADGWYSVIAAVLGLLAGAALTWWRSRDLLVTTLATLAGSAAAAGVMAGVGRLLGPPDPETLLGSVDVGTRLAMPLEVTSTVCYLVWPIATLVGALVVLWSPPAESYG